MRNGHAMTIINVFVRASIALGITVLATAADIPKDESVPATSVRPKYQLGPEDVIDVFVWKEPDLTATVTIRPDGKISLPLAGELVANGKTAAELEQEVQSRLKRYVNEPVVNVIVKDINSLKISVLGEVHKPDVYRIKSRITILDAIAMAGGLTDLAKPNRIVVLQNTAVGKRRIVVSMNQLVHDQKGAPLYLEPTDTLYVEGR